MGVWLKKLRFWVPFTRSPFQPAICYSACECWWPLCKCRSWVTWGSSRRQKEKQKLTGKSIAISLVLLAGINIPCILPAFLPALEQAEQRLWHGRVSLNLGSGYSVFSYITGLPFVRGKKNNWKHVMFPLLMRQKLSTEPYIIFLGSCFLVPCSLPGPGQARTTRSSLWNTFKSPWPWVTYCLTCYFPGTNGEKINKCMCVSVQCLKESWMFWPKHHPWKEKGTNNF